MYRLKKIGSLHTFLLFLFHFAYSVSIAQYINESMVIKQHYDFVNPVDVPLFLSGNFGEPRSTHFHTGLDIRTQGRIGLNVNAIDDGYVSRIGVSGKGYGKVLYITHPQHQMTSVYAHLNDFYGEIKEAVRNIQLGTKQCEFDTTFPPGFLKIKKGDVIAASGNTGGSGGPHLHFEIRDSRNDEAINPELVGFKIKDPYAPSVFSLKLYDLSERKQDANGKIFPLRKIGSHYTLGNGTIYVNALSIGASVQAIDKSFNSIGRNGIYSMRLFQDDQLIFESKMDRIHFEDWRYSYSYSDCGERMRRDAIYHKCFVDDCNEAKIYETHLDRGKIHLKSNQASQIKIEVMDRAGNKNTIQFQVMYQPGATCFTYKPVKENQDVLDCRIENYFETEDVKVIIPTFCLADNIKFNYSYKPSNKFYSDIHQIHTNTDPLLDSIFVEIKTRNLPPHLRNKALLAYYDGGALKSAGGEYKNGRVSTWFAKFASYVVAVDTTPPKVLSCNIQNNKVLKSNMISFRVVDYLSGLKNFQLIIDGVWTPMDYDAKSHHLFYKFEKPLDYKLHDVYLEMRDFKNNVGRYHYTFIK